MRRRFTIGLGVALVVAMAAAWWLGADVPTEGPTLAEVTPERQRKPKPRRPAPRTSPHATSAAEPAAVSEQPPGSEVRCRVGDTLSGWPVRLFDLVDGHPLDWRIEDGALVFEPSAAAGVAGLTWGFVRRASDEGASFSRVTWSGAGEPTATCVVERLPPALDAAIFGRVRGAERLPEGTVFLEGCGLQERGESSPIDVDGGFFLQAQSGRCSLRAWRKAGLLRIPGPWVEVDARAGADAEVDLTVPTFEPAGMGIGFRPIEGGVVVNQVHAGTPAAAAGLQPGDVITAIDGVDTHGMDVEDFLVHGVGPAGTDVQLEGQTADGEEFAIVVRRATIQ